jgi:hypothetical protein
MTTTMMMSTTTFENVKKWSVEKVEFCFENQRSLLLGFPSTK